MLKKCGICGKEFDADGRVKYCSDECKKINKKNIAKLSQRKRYQEKKNAENSKIKAIDDLITNCIQDEFDIRLEKIENKIGELTLNMLARKLNINHPSVKSVSRGTCDLGLYRNVIGKMEQIISSY